MISPYLKTSIVSRVLSHPNRGFGIVVKKLTYLFSLVFVLAGSHLSLAATGSHFVYNELSTKTGKRLKTYHKTLTEDSSGQIKIQRSLKGKNYTQDETYVLDSEYATLSWSVKRADKGTDYSGGREGNVLYIKGKLAGKSIDKEITLDDRPLYNHPKVNLTKFVLSDQDNIEFWGLRKATLMKYVMQAKKMGEEIITVDGQAIDTIKVYFSPTGPLKKYYRRTYYFRKSDGLFIKKKPSKGKTTVLDISHQASDASKK